MANFLTSSIGKKFIQAVSGAFLFVFLLLHATINVFSVRDSFAGEFGSPEGWFAQGCEFMALPVVDVMVPILALGFLIHICYGIYLTIGNYKARGGQRYEVASKAASDSWAAKNMVVLGLLILGLLGFHLTHFWAKMQLQDFIGSEAEDPYLLLCFTFKNWWMVVIYIAWFVILWFHLVHGFWSMFQTIGWNSKRWLGRLKVIGVVVATLICLAFAAVAVNAFLQANALIA
ncbi:MAG: succinate dehydrogenase cytochrome b subunit [Bacteroidales bacterium]|nr:succinate dehydrogenase cytochrome b subunit [Bacteroidales bacterium]